MNDEAFRPQSHRLDSPLWHLAVPAEELACLEATRLGLAPEDGWAVSPRRVGRPRLDADGHRTPEVLTESERDAIQICARCAHREACLDYALTEGIDTDIWGGLTPRGRAELQERRDR